MNDTLELIDLESLMSDELRCQSDHSPEDLEDGEPICGEYCSIKVVARKRVPCSGLDFLICENSRIWNEWWIGEHAECGGCGRDLALCWTITPI